MSDDAPRVCEACGSHHGSLNVELNCLRKELREEKRRAATLRDLLREEKVRVATLQSLLRDYTKRHGSQAEDGR